MSFKWLYLTLLTTCFLGCSNDIIVNEFVNPQPVIYSILNVNDSIYTVSLTKTFLGDTNALILARDSEKVFYSNAKIKLFAIENGESIWETSFVRQPIGKVPGIFPEVSGSIYHSKSAISSFDRNGFFSGVFKNIDSFELSIQLQPDEEPIKTSVPVFVPNSYISPSKPQKIGLYNTEPFEVVIRDSKETGYCQLNIVVHYLEKKIDQDDLILVTQSIILRKDIPVIDKKIRAPIPPEFFLNKLVANIPLVSDLHYRKFVDFDFQLISVDETFKNYIGSYQYTTDLCTPAWSNIENGIGIFSLMYMNTIEGMTLDQRTKDSLALSPITKSLKFNRWQ